MGPKARTWCDICRDDQPDVSCHGQDCHRKFHVECLRNTNLLTADDNLSDYLCQDCKEDEENDEFCYLCREHDKDCDSTLLMCDGCPRSAHLACLKLDDVPGDDSWFCPVCDPSLKTKAVTSTVMTAGSGGKSKLGNVDICYVCQKSGKLIGCDFCEQSFHPMCISQEFLEFDLEKEWPCPICRGDDPLKNMKHKRMTKVERVKMSAEWQKCIRRLHRQSRMNRDLFLWRCRDSILPFVSEKTMVRLKKSAENARKALGLPMSALKKEEPARPEAATQAIIGKKAKTGKDVLKGKRTPVSPQRASAAPERSGGAKVSGAGVTKVSASKVARGGRVGARRAAKADSSDAGVEERTPPRRGASGVVGRTSRRSAAATKSETQGSVSAGSGGSRGAGSRRSRRQVATKEAKEKAVTIKGGVPRGGRKGKKVVVDSDDSDDEEKMREGSDESEEKEESGCGEGNSDGEAEAGGEDSGEEEVEKSEEGGESDREEDDDDDDEEEGTGEVSAAFDAKLRDEIFKTANRKARLAGFSLLKEGVTLKGYQRTGCAWLFHAFHHKAGAVLADEMGLGKTIQTLTFLSLLKAYEINGPHLVVVPLSTVGNWAREIRRFVPHMTFTKLCGSRAERSHIMKDPVASDGLYDIYITTYETVCSEEAFFADKFGWQCIVLDEAHRIKNESGRIRHSLDRVAGNMRVLLTGTPLQNNIKELFTLLNFLFPDVLKDSEQFELAFQIGSASAVGNPRAAIAAGGGSAAMQETELHVDSTKVLAVSTLLSKLLLRRTKDVVVRLPPKIEHDVWLPLSASAAKWYIRLLEISGSDLNNESVRKLLGTVIKMRVCCCHPAGLVNRETQYQKFLEIFRQSLTPRTDYALEDTNAEANGIATNDSGRETFEVVEMDAQKMRKSRGWEHLELSSKMVFLDKLLCQLHRLNMDKCASYEEAYLDHRYRQLRQQLKERKEEFQESGIEVPADLLGEDGQADDSEERSPTSKRVVQKKLIEWFQSLDPAIAHEEPTYDSSLMAEQMITVPVVEKEDLAREAAEAKKQKTVADAEMEDNGSDGDEEERPETPAKEAESGAAEFMESLRWSEDGKGLSTAGPLEVEGDDGERNAIASGDGGLAAEVATPAVEAGGQGVVVMLSATGEEEIASEAPVSEKNSSPPTAPTVSKKMDDDEKEASVGGAEDKGVSEKAKSIATSSSSNRSSPPGSPQKGEVKMHKVLVFTQFQLALDELERYCQWRGWQYMRLDGSTNKLIRELDIREFNSPESTHLIYLIGTRAGGLGINLVTANNVVLYDEDWNPFVDMQAIDRAHRIGQQREVHIWKLITEWTVEERMAFRRLQKLKLDQAVIQGRVESLEAPPEGGAEGVEEKLTAEEIRRLLCHGRTAIMSLCSKSDKLPSGGLDKPVELWKVEDFLNRKREALPTFVDPEEIEDGPESTSGAGSPGSLNATPPQPSDSDLLEVPESGKKRRRISVAIGDAMLDEGEELQSSAPLKSESSTTALDTDAGDEECSGTLIMSRIASTDSMVPSNGASSVSGDGAPGQAPTDEQTEGDAALAASLSAAQEGEGEEGRGVWRSRRTRRKPVPIYVAQAWQTKEKSEKKIQHERRCFRCQAGTFPGKKEKDGAETASPQDSLVQCFRCPKVYHKTQCLGLDTEPRKTWLCPWHECCICFRKGTQAGGVLIHCAECPTAFCADCFPPEYTRYTPEVEYFEELHNRGWPVDPGKFILFLCSKCKAVKAQKRRRKLTKQQLEDELRAQKADATSAKLEAASRKEKDKKERDDAREQKKKQASAKRAVSGRKKDVDDEEKMQETRLRTSYQKLFPADYMAILQQKREALENGRELSARKKGSKASSASSANAEAAAGEEAASGKGGPVSPSKAARDLVRLYPGLRYPGDALKLCENCRVPYHVADQCPYPAEVVRKAVTMGTSSIEIEAVAKGESCVKTEEKAQERSEPGKVEGGEDNAKARADSAKGEGSSADADGQGASGEVKVAAEGAPAVKEEPAAGGKMQMKAFCSCCGVASRFHSRRVCPNLPVEEAEKYVARRNLMEEVISKLASHPLTIASEEKKEQTSAATGKATEPSPCAADSGAADASAKQEPKGDEETSTPADASSAAGPAEAVSTAGEDQAALPSETGEAPTAAEGEAAGEGSAAVPPAASKKVLSPAVAAPPKSDRAFENMRRKVTKEADRALQMVMKEFGLTDCISHALDQTAPPKPRKAPTATSTGSPDSKDGDASRKRRRDDSFSGHVDGGEDAEGEGTAASKKSKRRRPAGESSGSKSECLYDSEDQAPLVPPKPRQPKRVKASGGSMPVVVNHPYIHPHHQHHHHHHRMHPAVHHHHHGPPTGGLYSPEMASVFLQASAARSQGSAVHSSPAGVAGGMPSPGNDAASSAFLRNWLGLLAGGGQVPVSPQQAQHMQQPLSQPMQSAHYYGSPHASSHHAQMASSPVGMARHTTPSPFMGGSGRPPVHPSQRMPTLVHHQSCGYLPADAAPRHPLVGVDGGLLPPQQPADGHPQVLRAGPGSEQGSTPVAMSAQAEAVPDTIALSSGSSHPESPPPSTTVQQET